MTDIIQVSDVIDGYFSGFVAPPAVPYIGPGDKVPGATAWWGLRAYSGAIVTAGTQKICNLRRDSDNATVDIIVSPSGGLGLTANAVGGATNGVSVATFKGGANLFVTKLYDQISGQDAPQTTAGLQPPLTLNVLGTLPAIDNTASGLISLQPTLSAGTAQPYSASGIWQDINGGIQQEIFQDSGGNQVGLDSGSTNYFLNDGIVLTKATVGGFHAAQFVFNAAVANSISIDGSTTTGAGSGGGLAGGACILLANTAGGAGRLLGYFLEFGLWYGLAFSGTNISDLNTNEHTYWGF